MSGLLTFERSAGITGRPNRVAASAMGTVMLLLALATPFVRHVWVPPQGPPLFEERVVRLATGTTVKVGIHEITYALWRECHSDGACEFLPKPGSSEADGQFPVTGVNRIDVGQFIAWINTRTGLGYRLPTLAEWRGIAGIPEGETTRKLFDDPRRAWAADYGTTRSFSRQVKPSGHFGLARSGVTDIDGNVWEWTATCVADIDAHRCPAYYAAGDHIAEIPIFLRDSYGGGCSTGAPPANLGFRLLRD